MSHAGYLVQGSMRKNINGYYACGDRKGFNGFPIYMKADGNVVLFYNRTNENWCIGSAPDSGVLAKLRTGMPPNGAIGPHATDWSSYRLGEWKPKSKLSVKAESKLSGRITARIFVVLCAYVL